MARIKDEDVAAVRAAAQIRDVVGDYVTLKSAGGGSYKGLCPFHDERTPSFHVTPAKGLYHCFSCQEGGDLITFVRKVEGLSFTEAVEKLANRYGIALRYEDAGPGQRQAGQRARLVAAHAMASAFYSEALNSPEAQTARDFLTGRGFPAETWSRFAVGYAPKGWDALTNRLRANGYTDEEMLAAGLVAQGQRGVYDRFRGRLVWPIRDTSGDTVGFGARKLYDDDEGPKYLNTPETPIYKKSQVLYGLDLARRDIARAQQVVVVEGYTDVMACHLAGVPTAVATCGTAFGSEHVKIMRRLLLDAADSQAEVIFTFDGDAAGQKAALRAFEQEQQFVTQTFVAVAADGLDPCDLRLAHGDVAVAELVRSRIPMFEFVIKSVLRQHDLETAEGRVSALRECSPVVAGIKDTTLRPEYVRMLAGWLGMDEARVNSAISEAGKRRPAPTPPQPRSAVPTPPPRVDASANPALATDRATVPSQGGSESSDTAGEHAPSQAAELSYGRPSREDRTIAVQREALGCALQNPQLVAQWYDAVEASAFTWEGFAAVHRAIEEAGRPSGMAAAQWTEQQWVDAVLAACADDTVRSFVRELATRPLPVVDVTAWYATSVVARLLEHDTARQIDGLRGRLQRLQSQGESDDSEQMHDVMTQLSALEGYRRQLRDIVAGQS
jgi:DNA primase